MSQDSFIEMDNASVDQSIASVRDPFSFPSLPDLVNSDTTNPSIERPEDIISMTMQMDQNDNREDQTVIWGTTIDIEYFGYLCRKYLETHEMSEIRSVIKNNGRMLNLDLEKIKSFSSFLHMAIVKHPITCLSVFEMAVGDVLEQILRDTQGSDMPPNLPQLNVCPFNVKEYRISQLSRELTEMLVSVRGIVVRTSMVIPEMHHAEFTCEECHYTTSANVDRGRIAEPNRCTGCGSKLTFRLMHHLCKYEDKQIIKLQETPEEMRAGEIPTALSLIVFNFMVDSVVPGDVVIATGILRASPVRVNASKQQCFSVLRVHMDGMHLKKLKKRNAHDRMNEDTESFLSALENETSTENFLEEVERLKSVALRSDIYDILRRSLAPSIFGMEKAKDGLLALLFGGTAKEFTSSSCRGEINILLCGDPGLAKSQLLAHVHRISHRGVYVSGRSSSSVGLTAFISRDYDTGERVLESGALVLSDGGVCCIDEFDKMDYQQRNVLKEVMEQHTLSIAKAGIVCQLNARTSILAAANPRESKWNKGLTVVENLNLDSSILSRFDLIYLMLDEHPEDFHRSLTTHIIEMFGFDRPQYIETSQDAHTNRTDRSSENDLLLSSADLTKYIAYARSKIKPRLNAKAQQELVESYCTLRGLRSFGSMSPTLRTLESLIRLAEARAKMRWSNEVTENDVRDARNMVYNAWGSAGIDMAKIDEGGVDVSLVFGGAATQGPTNFLEKRLESFFESHKQDRTSITIQEIQKILGRSEQYSVEQIFECLRVFVAKNIIESFDANTVKLKGEPDTTSG